MRKLIMLLALSTSAQAAYKWDAHARIGFDATCFHGARQWCRAAGLKMKRGSDVMVEFADLGDCRAGTWWEVDGERIVKAHITINPNKVFAPADVQAVLLHELGHALGLSHTMNSEDVMYLYFWGNMRLSEGDKTAIRALYRRR